MSPEDIENVFTQQSELSAVSVAKLRLIYTRGVKEAVANGHDGPIHTYGLARVQRYLSSVHSGNPRVTEDSDLLPRHSNTPATPNTPIEYSDEDFKSFQLISAVLTGEIAQVLPEAEHIEFDAETKELFLSTDTWTARIDLRTSEYISFSQK